MSLPCESRMCCLYDASQHLKFGEIGRQIYPSPSFTLLLLLTVALSWDQERNPRAGLVVLVVIRPRALERAGAEMSLPGQRAFILHPLSSNTCCSPCLTLAA